MAEEFLSETQYFREDMSTTDNPAKEKANDNPKWKDYSLPKADYKPKHRTLDAYKHTMTRHIKRHGYVGYTEPDPAA